MKPRSRFRLLYWAPVVIAFVTGYALDRRATSLRVADVDRRLEALSTRLDEISASMKKRSAESVPSAVSSERESRSPVEGYEQRSVCRPRVLGSGRTGQWFYTDVRHADGQVLRYYLRRDASPVQVKSYVRQIAGDARDRSGEY